MQHGKIDQKQPWAWRIASIVIVFGVVALIVWWALLKTVYAPGEKIANQGNQHIASADSPHEPYNSNPPTSGPHLGMIDRWGIHTSPIPDELQVHNLEDGGVIVRYRPDRVSEDDISALEAIVVESKKEHVTLVPRPKMDSAIALTAWTRLMTLERIDRTQMLKFIRAYEGIDHHVRGVGSPG